MSNIIIRVENLSKQYRLGNIGTGTLRSDFQRFWANLTGKEDPTLKIGQENTLQSQEPRTKNQDDYVWALRDINFEVKQGEVLGIIGKNGAGKSTLLKILSQVTTPSTGNVKVKGRIASLLEVGTGFHPELTGRENIFLNGAILGMYKTEIRSKFDEIVDFAGVAKYIDTPVKRYSSGMYVRLAFAVAAHLEPEILIIDEVLSVGDAEFQKKCLGKMKDVSKLDHRTVLYVSHNLPSVQAICDQAIFLEYGKIKGKGDVSTILDLYLNKFENIDKKDLKSQHGFIKNVDIYCDGSISNKFNVGCNFRIELEFDHDSPMRSPVFGLVIKDFKDEVYIGVNNRHYQNFEMDNPAKQGKLIAEIPYLPLLPGNYIIDIYLGDGAFDIDYLKDTITIEVLESNYNSTGVPLNRNINKVFIKDISWKIEYEKI